MTFLAASDGVFQGTLESTVALVVDDSYTLQVDIAEGGVVGQRKIAVIAALKGAV